MRYVIQFSKQGAMRYISHLDLLRLFKRSFKRVGIKLEHSQGFNPHPKMSFVQPLSLGYTSTSEYLEFETVDLFADEEIVYRLNTAMPGGVTILSCRTLPPTKKTLAAMVEYGKYHLQLPLSEATTWADKIVNFLEQKQIIVQKKQKKTKKLIDQDIRPMIYSVEPFNGIVNDNEISLTMVVCAGSNCNLNPEVLIRAFCQYADIPYVKETLRIEREDLYCFNVDNEEFVAIKDLSFQ